LTAALAGLPDAGESVLGTLAGPAGDLECFVAVPRGEIHGVAVACHPHPLYGGAMSNKVVYALASAALAQGLVAARFNFRGVGQSQGTYDSARGETDDCLAVVEWLRAQRPGLPLLLAGFSFGAYVSLKAAATAQPAALVSIAPPFGRYFDEAALPPHPGCPWLAVHSRDDDTVSYDETSAILRDYEPAPTLVTVDGAGHFFHGRLQDIKDAVAPFLQGLF
jgi:alpha/beta superfamily hydrolase